jgi:hypothetical protein
MNSCVNFIFVALILTHGAVAQLGERMNGIHEARGSIPLSSTRIIKGLADFQLAPFSLCRRQVGDKTFFLADRYSPPPIRPESLIPSCSINKYLGSLWGIFFCEFNPMQRKRTIDLKHGKSIMSEEDEKNVA